MPAINLITVVVATYNRSETVALVLAGLSAQDDKQFEVVIADDGSTREHREAMEAAARRVGMSVTHVWHPDVGFTLSQSRNLGVGVANGSYFVFLDGDCVPEVDFIRRHRMLSEIGYMVVGSRVLLSESLTQLAIGSGVHLNGQSLWFWLTQRVSGQANKLGSVVRMPDFGFRKCNNFRWRGIRGCNMGVWRADFEAINGFDQSFVGWGHEDADFVLRLHNLGVERKNGYYATEVYHLWHHEAKRDAASSNAGKVQERLSSGLVQATIGYRESRAAKDVVVHRWG